MGGYISRLSAWAWALREKSVYNFLEFARFAKICGFIYGKKQAVNVLCRTAKNPLKQIKPPSDSLLGALSDFIRTQKKTLLVRRRDSKIYSTLCFITIKKFEVFCIPASVPTETLDVTSSSPRCSLLFMLHNALSVGVVHG